LINKAKQVNVEFKLRISSAVLLPYLPFPP